MSKIWRAIAVSAAATAVAGAAWMILSDWCEKTVQAGEGEAAMPKQRSREDLVDDLSDDQKQQLLDELSQHI